MRSRAVHLRLKRRVAAAAATSVVLVAVMPRAAVADSVFLRLDGIPGDSNVARFENQIVVSSFAWGVANPTRPGGGGGGSARAAFQDLTVTKLVDAASPPLFAAVAAGRHIADATL